MLTGLVQGTGVRCPWTERSSPFAQGMSIFYPAQFQTDPGEHGITSFMVASHSFEYKRISRHQCNPTNGMSHLLHFTIVIQQYFQQHQGESFFFHFKDDQNEMQKD